MPQLNLSKNFCEQMRKWEAWEDETQTLQYQIANGNLMPVL